MEIQRINQLPWPQAGAPTRTIQCAGNAYCQYFAFAHADRLGYKSNKSKANGGGGDGGDGDGSNPASKHANKSPAIINLLEVEDLSKFTYYEVLNVQMTGGPKGTLLDKDLLKKAYHRACLTYHPDKTGRGEEDEVFLLVKAAYDTLSDDAKRLAYDSNLEFDDSIPDKPGTFDAPLKPKEFYAIYGPVFERNLRFSVAKAVAKNGKTVGYETAPAFGDDSTSIEDVNLFYKYWINFESWRDFSLAASKILKHDLESAEDRYHKRYMEKEIDRKAKALKKDEISRISRLVENAMSLDPRLKRHKEEVARAKQKAKEERLAKERAKKEAIRKRQEEDRRIEEEKEAAAKSEAAAKKAKKEQRKKIHRKQKQLLRKLSLQAYNDDESGTWKSVEEASEDIEFLCEQLEFLEIKDLVEAMESIGVKKSVKVKIDVVSLLKKNVDKKRMELRKEKDDEIAERKAARAKAKSVNTQRKENNSSPPWSKEEIATLAKAVKKYPAGGAQRWDTIANFLNNALRLKTPRTKEECIQQYNLAKASSLKLNQSSSEAKDDTNDVWTEDQDRLLQQGLAKYPASMGKNERWSSIAKLVSGKSKKQCVQRFKIIREALKNKK